MGKAGGKRPGAGRKPGSKNKKTIEIEAERERVHKLVSERLEPLINAQISEAMGVQFLFRIDYSYKEVTEEYKDKAGRKRKRKKKVLNGKKTTQVTDPEEIKDFIMGKTKKKDVYYFITTQRPNSKAIDSLVDRLIGKSTQPFEGNIGLTMGQILDEAEEED